MKYIDVLFISSMEYNIYISTGRRLTGATSHIVLNAIEYIFKNECECPDSMSGVYALLS